MLMILVTKRNLRKTLIFFLYEVRKLENSFFLPMSAFHLAIRREGFPLFSLSEGRRFMGGVARRTSRESLFLTRV